MPKKGENIYKRKDGRWEGRYIKGYLADGKAKYAYVYGKTYFDVKQKLIDDRIAFAQGKDTARCKTKYRDILQSGKFYVEYELDDVKKTLAVQDNKRMDYTIYKKTGNIGLAVGLSLINPLLAVGALLGGNKSKVPSAYYEAGKRTKG